MERKALVVDDDVYCLDIFIEYLQDKGFNVASSLNPTCLLIEKKLAKCPMDVPCFGIILSDNQMPEMTGLEFFQYQSQRGCKIPVHRKALISGDISPKERDIAEGMGCQLFQKPTSLESIDAWIDSVLDERVNL
ncbi:Response regulator receiver domain-containing protein [Desulfuromusa kysingii]|uniref:Response regulator receiver domain-containing protein n=1 Tax=Desulfuromusa kysingii TaxID=37625 RepID=A0A1H3W4M1_9BACT|nr:hypothetical protein [Desulfuromusa kysingii]SDZ82069.1 Response regulator receiver domain-containing protein [Desulfuromusa kysingii]